ncbi:Rv2175c family DNA-binding protein [Lysinibacter sp. HNR]|uniref:Rv2175c family DNA-binding protein n=1 Tax=Lysinibacter sp. HNR TaxID=3031408 RepID=UPI002434B352|nr:Rv2175c family DNA-binding protein [Lysinibacter sp. HNR]WGD36480.1 Rv2175c family DNA-binding protein [Lysinibacter sp. HNR]
MTHATHDNDYYTIPDLVEMFDVGPGRIHRLIEQRDLAAIRVEGILKVPSAFVLNDEPLSFLKGTLMVLEDAGFSNEEAVSWLLSDNDTLGTTPIEALRNGRKTEVRRVALALAF